MPSRFSSGAYSTINSNSRADISFQYLNCHSAPGLRPVAWGGKYDSAIISSEVYIVPTLGGLENYEVVMVHDSERTLLF